MRDNLASVRDVKESTLGRALPIRNTHAGQMRDLYKTSRCYSLGRTSVGSTVRGREGIGEGEGKGCTEKNTVHVRKMGEPKEPSDLDNRLANVEN